MAEWDAIWTGAQLRAMPEAGQWLAEGAGWRVPMQPGGEVLRSMLHLRWPVAVAAVEAMHFTVAVQSRGTGSVCFRVGEDWCGKPLSFLLGASGVVVHSEASNVPWAENDSVGLQPERGQVIEFHADPQQIRMCVDGREAVVVARPRTAPLRGVTFFTRNASTFRDITVRARGLVPAPTPVRRARPMLLSSSVDFCHGPVPDARFDDLPTFMRELAGVGVERVNWIVQAWAPDEKQQEGFAEAHKRGMEVVAVLKWTEFGKTDWSAREKNTTEVGRFGFDHPEVYARRAPLDDSFAPVEQPIHMLELVCDRTQELRAEDFQLWCGDERGVFTRYDGPAHAEVVVESRAQECKWERTGEPARPLTVLRFRDLNVTTPCVALAYRPLSGNAQPAGNLLHRLLRAYAADGRPVYAQWGLRFALDGQGGIAAATRELFPEQLWDNDDFGASGPGWLGGPDRTEWMWCFPAAGGVLALRRHFDPITDRIFSPAVPAMRRFFTALANRAIDWGADAVDLRILNHLRSLDLTDLHFNPAVCAAYEARHGVPLTRQTVDRVHHQTLMADFYTQFVREIAQAVRARGRRLHHHINSEFDAPPTVRGLLSMYWDWQRWISEGLLDEIFLKDVRLHTELFDQATMAARNHGLPIVLSRQSVGMFGSDPQAGALMRGFLDEARELGMDGYDLYDGRHLIMPDAQGRLTCRRPDVAAVLQAQSGRRVVAAQ